MLTASVGSESSDGQFGDASNSPKLYKAPNIYIISEVSGGRSDVHSISVTAGDALFGSSSMWSRRSLSQ